MGRSMSQREMGRNIVALEDCDSTLKIKMADVPAQANLNEAALKRFDPYVKEILDTAKHVALYTYYPEEDEWKKTNVEGSLFVYSRTGEPFYNILVLNRLNTTNLIEPISHTFDLQLREPFLLYLNTKFCIYGIWFYEIEECTRLATLIQELMNQSGGKKRTSVNNMNNKNGGTDVDIYSMLSKAQEAYNTSKTTNNNGKSVAVKNNLTEEEQTPQSVMEFFAKAGSAPLQNSTQKPPVSPTGSRIILGRSQSLTTRENKDKAPMNPLIHQLMSNPVHSVEHIEKQQRSVTPQADSSNSQVLKNLIRPSSGQPSDVEPQLLDESPNRPIKVEEGLNEFNFLRISSPSFQTMFPRNNADSLEFKTLLTPRTPLDTPQKPALMPPAMFTPSASKDTLTIKSGFTLPVNDQIKPEPLTRNQLLQALNYLLKNDADFMTKIHEAYVKSLSDKVL